MRTDPHERNRAHHSQQVNNKCFHERRCPSENIDEHSISEAVASSSFIKDVSDDGVDLRVGQRHLGLARFGVECPNQLAQIICIQYSIAVLIYEQICVNHLIETKAI